MKSALLALTLSAAGNAKNIVELAQDTPQLSTLVAAVVAADLVDTLSAPGSLTVFAPTNDAFAALPAGVLDDLLKPENKAALQQVLTYHVLGQEFKYLDEAGKLVDGYKPSCGGVFNSLAALPVTITQRGVGPFGSPQTISQSNIEADNGLVHIVNGVLLPSLVETGRLINITSYNDGHSRLPGGNCQEKYRKGQFDIQEGKCYNRKFVGQDVNSNDQRAYCTCVPGHGSDCYTYKVVSYQYPSTDGTCQNPPSTNELCVGQEKSDFIQGCGNYFGEILVFQCPQDMVVV